MSQRSQPYRETSRSALHSHQAPTAREQVRAYIEGCGPKGATDAEVEAALAMRHQTASARRRDLVKAGHVIDSGNRRATDSGRTAIVWVVAGAPKPEPEPAPPAFEGMRVLSDPEHPLPVTQRGLAVAAAALAASTFLGRPMRLLWVVDLDQIRGPVVDPTKPDGSTWGALLERFRGALDRQAWGTGADAPVGLHVAYTCQITRRRLLVTFKIPHWADLRVLTGGPPPVGRWMLWPVGDEADRPADMWWLDDIPF